MNNEVISNRQGQSILILFILGTTIAIPVGKQAGNDIWLALIIAISCVLIFCLMYARILMLYTGRNLFEIALLLFGRIFGRIVILLYALYALHVGAMVLRLFGEFVLAVTIPETPMAAVIIIMAIFTIWMAEAGLQVMGRWSSFFLIINIIIPITLFLLLIDQMDLGNIKPLLYNGIEPVLSSAFTTFAFPFAQVIIFTMLFSTIQSQKSPLRIFTVGLLVSGGVVLIIATTSLLVLGAEISQATFFIYSNASKRIAISPLVDRISEVVLITALLTGFIKASVCLMASSKGIARLFNFKHYNFLSIPVGAIMCNIAFFTHENIFEMTKWANEIYPYYQLPFQVIFPLIILFFAEIKNGIFKKGSCKKIL